MCFSNVIISTGNKGFVLENIGLRNFVRAFTEDPEFNRMLTEEITRMAINVPAVLIVSFIMSLLLNQDFKGRGLVRAVFFLPVILSSGVLIGLEFNNSMLDGMKSYIQENSNVVDITASLQEILSNSGMGTRFLNTVYDILNSVYEVVLSSGIQIIIFLSALQSIPKVCMKQLK